MATPVQLDADYVVYGAGAMGMAFVDALLSESGATVVIVDKEGQPGGHWNHAYPFVRLHQPSSFYGVNSRPLERDRRDYSSLASRNEILAYYEGVMRDFVQSKRVQYFPMCICHDPTGSWVFHSLVDKQVVYRVGDRAKIVNATYLTAVVPSLSCAQERYQVADKIEIVPPNALPQIQQCYDSYVIIGAGKTGMDAVLWLLDNRVQPSRISWITPRDSWLMMREALTPNADADRAHKLVSAGQTAGNVEEFMLELEKIGLMGRIDQSVTPTMNHCAVVSADELGKLRSVTSIVRMGHVLRVEPGQVSLQEGVLSVPGTALYVDCSTNGLTPRPSVKVFDGTKITLQSISLCQQVFSAAWIARVEIKGGDDDAKNSLCNPTPHPETNEDFVRGFTVSIRNKLAGGQAGLNQWLRNARLNRESHAPDLRHAIPQLWHLLRGGYAGALLREGKAGVQALVCERLEKLLVQRSRL